MDWLLLIKIICIFLVTGYCLMLLIQTVCWQGIPIFKYTKGNNKTKISVIIAMRNEEDNICSCLQALMDQNYPSTLFEVIVMDDHSSDGSADAVKQFAKLYRDKVNIQLIRLTDETIQSSYKKFAISQGIKQTTGELIVTTDADCVAGKGWLACIASYYEEYKPVLMMAPVVFKTNSSLFSKIQALEFAGLIGMSASTNKAGFPLMCNGANLAYSRKAFEEINGFGNTPALASGDDTFLLFKMKDRYKKGIHFIKSKDANVVTNAQSTMHSFFQQRKRWASKTTKYNKPYVTCTGLLVYFFNVALLLTLILLFPYPEFSGIFIIMFSGKLIFEFIFMAVVCRFFEKEKLLWIFFPTSILFVPYVLMIGFAAPFGGSYRWKDRQVK